MADMRNSLRKFELDVSRFSANLKIAAEDLQHQVAFDLFSRIVKKTPVDTGRARASWTMAANRADRSAQPEGKKSYPEPSPPGRLSVKPGGTIWISNNLPYIVALEHGHSKRSPHGMVAISIEEVRNQLTVIERNVIQRAGL